MAPAPQLPLAVDPSLIGVPRFARRRAELDAVRWDTLKARIAAAGLTPSMMLCTAYAEVLGAWSASSRFTLNLTLSSIVAAAPRGRRNSSATSPRSPAGGRLHRGDELHRTGPGHPAPALGGPRPPPGQRGAGDAGAGPGPRWLAPAMPVVFTSVLGVLAVRTRRPGCGCSRSRDQPDAAGVAGPPGHRGRGGLVNITWDAVESCSRPAARRPVRGLRGAAGPAGRLGPSAWARRAACTGLVPPAAGRAGDAGPTPPPRH